MEECKLQSKKDSWYGLLHNKLLEIKDRHGIDAPIAKQLLKLDRESILKEAYARMIGEGKSREDALAALRKKGFSKKELDFL